jgi:putative transposase
MVTTATWERRPLFRNERWAKEFVRTLFGYREKAFDIHEFVLMPDHLHMLITPKITLERAVQFVKGGFSYKAQVDLGSAMEVWQRGFSDHRIRNAADYELHVKYIHENPVRSGLVNAPENYLFSSAHPGYRMAAVPQGLKPNLVCD